MRRRSFGVADSVLIEFRLASVCFFELLLNEGPLLGGFTSLATLKGLLSLSLFLRSLYCSFASSVSMESPGLFMLFIVTESDFFI